MHILIIYLSRKALLSTSAHGIVGRASDLRAHGPHTELKSLKKYTLASN